MSVRDLIAKMYSNVVELDFQEFTSRFGDLTRLSSVFDLPQLRREGVSYNKIYGSTPFSMAMAIRVIDDVKNKGVVMPIIMSEDGVVIDGMSRLTGLLMTGGKFPVGILPIKCKRDWIPCVQVALSTLTNKGSLVYSQAVKLITPILRKYNVSISVPNIVPVTAPTRSIRVEDVERFIDFYSTVPLEVRDMAKSWIPSLTPISQYLASFTPQSIAIALIYLAMKANCYMTRHGLGNVSLKLLERLHQVIDIDEVTNVETLRNTCLNKCMAVLRELGVGEDDLHNVPELYDELLRFKRTYPIAAASTVFIKAQEAGVHVKQVDVANRFNITTVSLRSTVNAYRQSRGAALIKVDGR